MNNGLSALEVESWDLWTGIAYGLRRNAGKRLTIHTRMLSGQSSLQYFRGELPECA